MNKFLCGVVAAALLAGCAGAAGAQVVDFEDTALDMPANPLVSDGFSFTVPIPATFIAGQTAAIAPTAPAL